MSDSEKGVCASMYQVRSELRLLIEMAQKNGDKEMERIFKSQLLDIEGAGTKRSRIGGGDKLCHALTTAMLMSSGAGIAYLSYLNIIPLVTKMTPKPCAGTMDQVVSLTLGWINPTASCSARQAAFDRFVTKVTTAALGAGGLTLTAISSGHKVISNKYNKVFEYNKQNVCPVVEGIVSNTKRGLCYVIPGAFRKMLSGLSNIRKTLDYTQGYGSKSSSISSVVPKTKTASSSPINKKIRKSSASKSLSKRSKSVPSMISKSKTVSDKLNKTRRARSTSRGGRKVKRYSRITKRRH